MEEEDAAALADDGQDELAAAFGEWRALEVRVMSRGGQGLLRTRARSRLADRQ